MAKAKFIIRKTENGNYVFALRSPNGENVGTGGEAYTTKKACEGGVASVIRNSAIAPIEDRTLKDFEQQKNPKFVLYFDKANAYRFRLCAANGEPIIASQGYTTKAACKNGIDSIRRNSPSAELTYEEPTADAAKGAKASAAKAAPAKAAPAKKAPAKPAAKPAKSEPAKQEAPAEVAPAKTKKEEKKDAKAAAKAAKAEKKAAKKASK